MVLSGSECEQHSKLCKSGSLDLPLEGLCLSPPAEEKPHVNHLEDLTSSSDCFSSESEYDSLEAQRASPFDVYYVRDGAVPRSPRKERQGRRRCSASLLELGPADSSEEISDSDEPYSGNESPHWNTIMAWTRRENRLSKAWERKRQLVMQEELMNLKERAKPQLLGRSASDCGKPMKDACDLLKFQFLQRSASTDFGKSHTGIWGTRTRSLTDHDFEELKGCIDLGFRFDESSIPELCDTLPALEVCCAIAQNLQDSPSCTRPASPAMESPPQCITPSASSSWSIASPGDDTEEIKERLKHWAQAVACNARLCY